MVIWFWQSGQGGKWQVICCLGSHQIIHDIRSLCISTMRSFNLFLLERTLNQDRQKWQKNQGKFEYHALLQHQAVLHTLLIPPLAFQLLLVTIILLLFFPIPLLLQEVWKESRPSLLSCRDM